MVYAIISPHSLPHDLPQERGAKMKASSEARKLLNRKAAWRRLEMILAANFTEKDLHVILTYRNSDYPKNRKEAVERLRKFLKQLRNLRKQRGKELKYVYVTEGRHGDKRHHHHIVINATKMDIEDIRALWSYGDQIDIEPIGDREYEDLAKYITKEAAEGKPVGAQMWTSSRNLTKPDIEISFVDENETLTAPAGSYVYERVECANEWAGYAYIKYRIEKPRTRRMRPSRAKAS